MDTSKSNTSAGGIREAVIGFDNDGNVIFYFLEDINIDEDGDHRLDDYRDIDQPTFPGEPEPIVALKQAGNGLWFDKPYEWVSAGAKPTGFIAFTEEDADFLRKAAEPGDLIIPFKKGLSQV